MYPKSHWNYRLIYHPGRDGSPPAEPWYGIHEVFYQKDRPWLYTEEPASFSLSDGSLSAAKAQTAMTSWLAQAIRDVNRHEVLSESDFPQTADDDPDPVPSRRTEIRRRVPRGRGKSKKRGANPAVVRRAKNK